MPVPSLSVVIVGFVDLSQMKPIILVDERKRSRPAVASGYLHCLEWKEETPAASVLVR